MLVNASRPGETPGASGRGFAPVAFTATAGARAALSRLGRTEDIRFSPDNRLIAVAAFSSSAVHVFGVTIDLTGDLPRVNLGRHVELRSPSFRQPHGIDFLDGDTLVVANRVGNVDVVRIPTSPDDGGKAECRPFRSIGWASLGHRIRSPGSVAVLRGGGLGAEILVCNNYRNRITRHRFMAGVRWVPSFNRVALDRGLDIPDGIAVSPDRSWIAVSNHLTASVALFGIRRGMRRRAGPVGVLAGIAYPHGVRFSNDGRRVYVADAGSPLVHMFESPSGDWSGERLPSAALAVMGEEQFRSGNASPQEGGPKGIDLDASGTLLVATCEKQPLAFFTVG